MEQRKIRRVAFRAHAAHEEAQAVENGRDSEMFVADDLDRCRMHGTLLEAQVAFFSVSFVMRTAWHALRQQTMLGAVAVLG